MTSNAIVIAQTLEKHKIPCEYDEPNRRFLLAAKLKNAGWIPISIQLRDDSTWLDICAPNLLQVGEQVYKGVFFQTILTHAWETSMVRFFHNPNNGSISASIDLPLVDMTLTEKVLMYCFTVLLDSLDELMPRLRCVLSTGRDPGRKTYLEQLVDKMPSESLEQLAQLIAMRQQQGESNL
jgi:hypothetical protein